MPRLRRFWVLPPGEKWATLEASVLLALVQGALWVGPRRAWLSLVRRACTSPAGAPEVSAREQERLAVVRRALGRAAARVPKTTCLGRALTGWLMLRERGLSAVVRLGVSRSPEQVFSAHAWLECHGTIVLEAPQTGKYVVLPRPPSSAE
jgi:hypothetical protein